MHRHLGCPEEFCLLVFHVVQIDFLLLLGSLLVFQGCLQCIDIVSYLLVVLLLYNQLLHEHLPLVLLRLEVALQLGILLREGPVLVVDSLRNVRDQL